MNAEGRNRHRSFDELMARHQPHAGARMRAWREVAGLTQVELAERMGVQQPSVSRWEAREDALLSTLVKVAEACGGYLHCSMRTVQKQPTAGASDE